MNQSIQKRSGDIINSYDVLLPKDGGKDVRSRMQRYLDWLDSEGRHWWDLDLAAYRDVLFDEYNLSPSSVSTHLSTIRGRYMAVLRSPVAKAEMYQYAERFLIQQQSEINPANLKAIVDEIRVSIIDAIHPSSASVRLIADLDPVHLRLTVEQSNGLIRSIEKLRDRAAVALSLVTGIREAELCALVVDDLYAQTDDGSHALHVRDGKGAVSRKIPYGENVGALNLVERWLEQEGITQGKVFNFTTRTFQRILKRHPVEINGRLVDVKPHDLRRTYARRCYEAGMSLVAIQQNLGHSVIKTTQEYIGELDGAARRPPEIFEFD